MMLGRLDKSAIWWIAGIAVTLLLVLGWNVSRAWLGNQAISNSFPVNASAEIASGQVEDRHHVEQDSTCEESSSDEQISIFDLLDACPELSGEFSEECQKALNAYFTEKPLVHTMLSWVKFPNALTYATIFKDPLGDRERVFAALERPECRFEEGKGIRVDLKKTCDAEAFARYSNFLEICEFGSDPGTRMKSHSAFMIFS